MTNQPSFAEIGIIGGTGVYDPTIFDDVKEVKTYTPYGPPSPFLSIGNYKNRSVAFIPRHGRDHSIPPHKINYRANIYALKELGVKRILSVSSVGSLREEIKPGCFVFPDQFIDRTKSRPDTFFDGAKVAHVSSADAFCPEIRSILGSKAKNSPISSRDGGTYICIEGPRFSSRAESRLFRQWGADIVGMTLYPEVILAREAELCYASVSMVTDYDVWADKPVSAADVTRMMRENVENAKKLIRDFISEIPSVRRCDCSQSLENAML